MAKKIRVYWIGVPLMVLAALILNVDSGLTADLSKILKEVKTKYAKFDKEIKDMTIVQTMRMTTPHGEMSSEMKTLKKGVKFRVEITTDMPQAKDMPSGMRGMKNVVIYDGKDTWMISPFMGKKKITGQEEMQYQAEGQWWNFLSNNAKIVGSEKVGKRDCHVVKIQGQSDSPFDTMWIDKKGFNLVKSESKGPDGQQVRMLNSDFRKIKKSWEIPYKTEMFMEGKLMSTTLVKSVKTNKGLKNSLFDPDQEKVEGGGGMMDMMKKMMERQ